MIVRETLGVRGFILRFHYSSVILLIPPQEFIQDLGHLLGEEEVVDEGEVEGGAGLRHQCRLCGSIFEGVAFLLYDHLEEEHGINNVDEKDLERHCVRLSAEAEEEAAAKKALAEAAMKKTADEKAKKAASSKEEDSAKSEEEAAAKKVAAKKAAVEAAAEAEKEVKLKAEREAKLKAGKEAKLKGLEGKRGRKSSKFGKASFMSDESSSEEETSQEEEKKVEREEKKSKLEEKPRVADDKNTEVVTEVLQQLLTIAPRATVFRKAGESEPADNEVGKKDAAEALHGVNLEEVAKEDDAEEKSAEATSYYDDFTNNENHVYFCDNCDFKTDSDASLVSHKEATHKGPVEGENTIAPKTTVIRLFSGTKRPQDLPLPASSPKRAKADEEKQVENVNGEGVAKVNDAEAVDDVTATQLTVVPPTQDLTRKLEGLVGLVESGSLSISLPALSRPSVIKLTPLSNRQNFKPAVPEFGDDGDGISDDDDDIEILN